MTKVNKRLVPGRPPNLSKNMKICKLRYDNGLTLQEIGDIFDMKREQVSRTLTRYLDQYVQMKRSEASNKNKN